MSWFFRRSTTREMEYESKPIKSGEVELTCAFCRGGGSPGGGFSYCQVCGGSGKVKVLSPYTRCSYCTGTGYSPTGSGTYCMSCRGKGVVTTVKKTLKCPRCGGTGQDEGTGLYCIRCRGQGKIPAA